MTIVVTDKDGNAQTISTTVNTDGSYSVDVPAAVADGGYSVSVSVTTKPVTPQPRTDKAASTAK